MRKENLIAKRERADLLDDLLSTSEDGGVLGLEHSGGVGLSHESLTHQIEGVGSGLGNGSRDASKGQEVKGNELAISSSGGSSGGGLLLSTDLIIKRD